MYADNTGECRVDSRDSCLTFLTSPAGFFKRYNVYFLLSMLWKLLNAEIACVCVALWRKDYPTQNRYSMLYLDNLYQLVNGMVPIIGEYQKRFCSDICNVRPFCDYKTSDTIRAGRTENERLTHFSEHPGHLRQITNIANPYQRILVERRSVNRMTTRN